MSDGKPNDKGKRWLKYAAFFIAGAVAMALLMSVRAYQLDQSQREIIIPGRDFPIEWLAKAGLKDDELKHLESIEELRRESQIDHQRLHFSRWLRKQGVNVQQQTIDAITQAK